MSRLGKFDMFFPPPLCKHHDISLGPGFKSSELWQGADREDACSSTAGLLCRAVKFTGFHHCHVVPAFKLLCVMQG